MKKLAIITLTFICLSLNGCYYYGYDDTEYYFETRDNYETTDLSIKDTESQYDSKPIHKPLTAPELTNVDSKLVYEIGDTFKHNGLIYKINSVKYSDNLDVFDCNNIPDNNFLMIDGKVKQGYVSMLVSITIKNSENRKEVYLNSYKLCSISNEGIYSPINPAYSYPIALTNDKNYQPNKNSKSYFKYVFESGEETTFIFPYVISEDLLRQNIDIIINDFGFTGYADEDVRFVKIKSGGT